jgi:hypothetical protein
LNLLQAPKPEGLELDKGCKGWQLLKAPDVPQIEGLQSCKGVEGRQPLKVIEFRQMEGLQVSQEE